MRRHHCRHCTVRLSQAFTVTITVVPITGFDTLDTCHRCRLSAQCCDLHGDCSGKLSKLTEAVHVLVMPLWEGRSCTQFVSNLCITWIFVRYHIPVCVDGDINCKSTNNWCLQLQLSDCAIYPGAALHLKSMPQTSTCSPGRKEGNSTHARNHQG